MGCCYIGRSQFLNVHGTPSEGNWNTYHLKSKRLKFKWSPVSHSMGYAVDILLKDCLPHPGLQNVFSYIFLYKIIYYMFACDSSQVNYRVWCEQRVRIFLDTGGSVFPIRSVVERPFILASLKPGWPTINVWVHFQCSVPVGFYVCPRGDAALAWLLPLYGKFWREAA